MTRPDATQVQQMSRALLAARRDRTPIAPLTERFPDMTIEDAYAVQQGLVAGLLAEGDSIIGYKLGLTSKPMQEMLGVDVHVRRLRTKVETDPAEPRHVVTVRGLGYRLES